MRSLYRAIAFLTVCSPSSSIHSEQLESMLIAFIEWTYGEPMTASSGCGGQCGKGGRGGHDGGVVVGGIEGSGAIAASG